QGPGPWAEGTPGPPVPVERGYFEQLREPPNLPAVRDWARSRLAELAAAGELPPEALQADATGAPPPAHHDKIARALGRHLANNYSYTLTHERLRPDLDPVEEFLTVTREGNCERFAAALLLALRSLHIPCQVVLGFQGCEDLGDGTHEVRQNQAHSWVE